jgi:hypothetical protein
MSRRCVLRHYGGDPLGRAAEPSVRLARGSRGRDATDVDSWAAHVTGGAARIAGQEREEEGEEAQPTVVRERRATRKAGSRRWDRDRERGKEEDGEGTHVGRGVGCRWGETERRG